ncbi:MAG: hypothetical protein U1E45_17465 [Geminicoccaceae bacterium]
MLHALQALAGELTVELGKSAFPGGQRLEIRSGSFLRYAVQNGTSPHMLEAVGSLSAKACARIRVMRTVATAECDGGKVVIRAKPGIEIRDARSAGLVAAFDFLSGEASAHADSANIEPAAGPEPAVPPRRKKLPPAAPPVPMPKPEPTAVVEQAPPPEPEAAAPTTASIEVALQKIAPAVAFVRADVLWLAIATNENVPELTLPAGIERLADPVESPFPVLRFRGPALAGGVRVDREGAVWRVRLGRQDQAPSAVTIRRDGAQESLLITNSGPAFEVTDPVVGDRLGLAASLEPDTGVPDARSFVDLEFLPSLQGAVWRSRGGAVRASAEAGNIRLTRSSGLNLASDMPVGEAGSAARPGSSMGLAGLAAATPADRRDARARLEAELASAPAGGRAGKLLDLGRLYLADALAPEAVTTLAGISAADKSAAPQAVQDVRDSLLGAAEVLLDRRESAATRLGRSAFDGDPEVALWRGVLAAAGERWADAAAQLGRAPGVLRSYPAPLRRRLAPLVAQVAWETGSTNQGLTALDQVRGEQLTPLETARMKVIEGQLLAREGRTDAALGALAGVRGGDALDAAVAARFLETTIALDAGRLEPSAALGRLKEQRLTWRGHPWESSMLERLGELQATTGEIEAALATWDQASTRTTREALRDDLAARSRQTLTDAVRGTSIPEVPAIAAFALYAHFADLLRDDPGRPGTVAALAQRLRRDGHDDLADRLAPAPAGSRPMEAGRSGDWVSLEREAAAAVNALPPTGPLSPEQGRQVILLAAARAAQGRPDPALAEQYRDRLASPAEQAHLALVTAPPPGIAADAAALASFGDYLKTMQANLAAVQIP